MGPSCVRAACPRTSSMDAGTRQPGQDHRVLGLMYELAIFDCDGPWRSSRSYWSSRAVGASSLLGMTVRLTVREMQLAEVGIRIDYFHEASDEHLERLGVDRALLPTREAWLAFYEEDFARPVPELEVRQVFEVSEFPPEMQAAAAG